MKNRTKQQKNEQLTLLFDYVRPGVSI